MAPQPPPASPEAAFHALPAAVRAEYEAIWGARAAEQWARESGWTPRPENGAHASPAREESPTDLASEPAADERPESGPRPSPPQVLRVASSAGVVIGALAGTDADMAFAAALPVGFAALVRGPKHVFIPAAALLSFAIVGALAPREIPHVAIGTAVGASVWIAALFAGRWATAPYVAAGSALVRGVAPVLFAAAPLFSFGVARTAVFVAPPGPTIAAARRAAAPPMPTHVPPTPTATPYSAPIITALEAVKIAVPQLRQRHPRGLVMAVDGSTRVGQFEYADEVREWVVDVWAPERGRSLQYSVIGRVLHEAATSSTIGPGGLAHIMALADQQLPEDLIDSDRAIELADAAGAAAFKREERAQLRSIGLSGKLDGSLVWHIFISRITVGQSRRVGLVIELDARTGGLTRYSDERVEPTVTPRFSPTVPFRFTPNPTRS